MSSIHTLSTTTWLQQPETVKTGLVISLDNPWLATSPDDKVHDPSATPPYGLAEYKNPHSAEQLTIPEACQQLKHFCLEKTENNTYQLKLKHDYYYQIQCQLYYTNTEWCDFVVHTEDIHIERISRNIMWWDQQLPKLKAFYLMPCCQNLPALGMERVE